MLLFYRIITLLVYFLSPLILIFRLINKKDTLKSFFEKVGKSNNKRVRKGKILWFHGSSVGEILGIIPLIEKLEAKKNIKQILITSNTLSSYKIISKLPLKKVVHQFFPIDTNFLNKKFINFWKPDLAIFVESEIWPNMILEIKKQKIPLVLLNARFTKKSFLRWKLVESFSRLIMSKFDICLAQNDETFKYLKKLGAKNIKKVGNLKFCKSELARKENKKNIYKNFLNSKKILFCAVSTHYNEEIFCGKIHKDSKNVIKNKTTIIIPRHINRSSEIKNDLEKISLKVQLHSLSKNLKKDTDIYLVDAYGETLKFLKLSKIAFLGGSLVDYKGHNPMEAARLGVKVLHGKYTSNHKEAYNLLKKINVSKKIYNTRDALAFIKTPKITKKKTQKTKKQLNNIGKIILSSNFKEICKYL